jgi:hypothetical protein
LPRFTSLARIPETTWDSPWRSATCPPAQAASGKIEFNYLKRNLMEPNIHLLTLALTAILVEADSDASFVSRNE